MANTKTASLKKLNIEHVFRPLYYYSRFSAQWSFSVIHDSNGKIQTARVGFLGLLWPILIISFTIILALDAYELLRFGVEEQVIPIRSIVGNVFSLCMPLFVAIEVVLNIINRKKFIDILEKFDTFDNEVRYFFKHFLFQQSTMVHLKVANAP